MHKNMLGVKIVLIALFFHVQGCKNKCAKRLYIMVSKDWKCIFSWIICFSTFTVLHSSAHFDVYTVHRNCIGLLQKSTIHSLLLDVFTSDVFNTSQQSWKMFMHSVCAFICLSVRTLVLGNILQISWSCKMLFRFTIECFMFRSTQKNSNALQSMSKIFKNIF